MSSSLELSRPRSVAATSVGEKGAYGAWAGAGMVLAAIPLLLIPYDSITHLLGADLASTSQTLPATALFSVPYLVLRRGRMRTCGSGRTVGKLLIALAAYTCAITIANVVFEAVTPIAGDVAARSSVALRQGASFALGVSSFFMFEDAILSLGWDRAAKICAVGALPSVALAAVQLTGGQTRVQGFSSEPAHFADYLVLAALPALFRGVSAGWRRNMLLGAFTLALLLTFSSTGFFKAGFAIALVVLSGRHVGKSVVLLVVAASLAYVVLELVPDNYLSSTIGSMHASYADTGEIAAGNFVDRMYGFIGPASYLGEGCSLAGCGFGADTVYFYQMFDPVIADIIASVKGDIVGLASLHGKLLLYSGPVGYIVWLLAWWLGWRAAPLRHESRFVLPTIFASAFFSLGPFFMPYTWLWLAIATAAGGEGGHVDGAAATYSRGEHVLPRTNPAL
jgi:hypothetical protein